MQDGVTFIDALDHSRAIQSSRVAGLATSGGIEGGAVQGNAYPAANSFRSIQDTGVELDQMRVCVIETFGDRHGLEINNPTGGTMQGHGVMSNE